MKKSSILFAFFLIVQTGWASQIPDGSYKGDGLWKSLIATGIYTIQTEITGNKIISTYQLSDGSIKEWAFEMKPSPNGFFTVLTQGAEVGNGYCIDHVPLCHYEVKMDNFKLEETLTVQNEKLYKVGSKFEGPTQIFWQESLETKL